MKKLNVFFSLLVLSGIILSNTQGGFTLDYTGSTGLNGSSCGASNCHGGTMGVDTSRLNVRVLNASNVDVTKTASGYAPGSTYDVEVKVKIGNKVKAGFQVVPLTFISSQPAGTVLNTVMPTMIQITPDAQNRQYVSHTTTGTTSTTVISGGYATWKFKWQAPATDIGALNFHCIANISNNNNGSDGDSVVLATFTIQKPSGLFTPNKATNITVYPNPTVDQLVLDHYVTAGSQAWILNYRGQVIRTQEVNSSTISLANLPSGSYILWLKEKSGKEYSAKFTKF